jgi:hypothetical protein
MSEAERVVGRVLEEFWRNQDKPVTDPSKTVFGPALPELVTAALREAGEMPVPEHGRIVAAAQEFGAAVLNDAEYGALLRLVRAELGHAEATNCERYLGEDWERRYQRQVRRLRRIERKLARQRLALRGGTKTY